MKPTWDEIMRKLPEMQQIDFQVLKHPHTGALLLSINVEDFMILFISDQTVSEENTTHE